jgi:hypothetical protein
MGSALHNRSGGADWTRPVIDAGSANRLVGGCPQESDALQRLPTAGQKRISRYQARPAPTHFIPRATFHKDGFLPPDAVSASVRGNWPSVLRHGRPFSFIAKRLLAVLARARA